MKRCSRCGIEKPKIEFSEHKRYADGLNCWCKSCVNDYARQNYNKNKVKYQNYGKSHKEEHKGFNRAWHQKKRERLNDFKTVCVKCGDTRKYLIDFHHIDPSTKKGNLSNMCLTELDQVLEDEIKKCVCLCRNCHFEFHYLYGNKPSTPVESLEEYLGWG